MRLYAFGTVSGAGWRFQETRKVRICHFCRLRICDRVGRPIAAWFKLTETGRRLYACQHGHEAEIGGVL